MIEAVEPATAIEMVCDRLADRGGTVHRTDQGDVIARADAPVFPDIAPERRPLGRGKKIGRSRVGAELVQEVELLHADVVGMDMVADCDIARRDPDDLPVFADGLPRRDASRGDLVAERDARRRDHLSDRHTGLERLACHRHIVRRVQANQRHRCIHHEASDTRRRELDRSLRYGRYNVQLRKENLSELMPCTSIKPDPCGSTLDLDQRSSIQAGAWSLAFSTPRTARSTPASVSRPSTERLTSR